MESIQDEIRQRYAVPDDVMARCLAICHKFSLSADDFLSQWESLLSAARSPFIAPTPQGLADLEAYLRQKTASEDAAAVAAAARIKDVKFSNVHSAAPRNNLPQTRVNFRPQFESEKFNYRYMHEKVSERSETLDDRIDEFAELVKEAYGVDELGDPAAVTEEDVLIVGRICAEPDTKLGETTLQLESSRMMGSGARVSLKFNPGAKLRAPAPGRSGLGLFPGAIVVLKGRNGGGGWFSVSEIWTPPPLGSSTQSRPSSGVTTGASVMIASGPYTFDADLEYKPFKALVREAMAFRPSILILLGPFVDANHPLIKLGDIDETPAELFASRITAPLRALFNNASFPSVFVIPSVRDMISDHAAFPQSAFDTSVDPNFAKTLIYLPNPSMISVSGITLAASSVDVLFHIKKEEYFKRAEDVDADPAGGAGATAERNLKDPMGLLCRHILEQRSFYPLFPVPQDLSSDVNLDISHSDLLRLNEAPDILVLPSMLKQFYKIVDNTLVINPSFASKYNSAGTYAKVMFPAAYGERGLDKVVVDIVKLEV
ncbi:hypothetical protein BOTBODRAFT_58411 [Botryobasidium botryosum FD-172 SS1]|uniref:DNA polymerase alpha subunit B n=1 Tax=Botryobasidium botryosum (strain FD-172 SS1) TaxID=930990 RepID=A0A067MDF6_BOTB1|nr:hypothetical protein BOTBODRAFT_58411 [Botryobasidium botryosum FD-172 SS1]